MKKILSISLVMFAFLINSCTSGQNSKGKTSLSATEFEAKIKELSTSKVVDVRSPEEYSSGHLQNSKNINWNGDDFAGQISKLDKTKPVFVYCKSGRRSASAAKQMRESGFTTVYELDGGILAWIQANLPLAN